MATQRDPYPLSNAFPEICSFDGHRDHRMTAFELHHPGSNLAVRNLARTYDPNQMQALIATTLMQSATREQMKSGEQLAALGLNTEEIRRMQQGMYALHRDGQQAAQHRHSESASLMRAQIASSDRVADMLDEQSAVLEEGFADIVDSIAELSENFKGSFDAMIKLEREHGEVVRNIEHALRNPNDVNTKELLRHVSKLMDEATKATTPRWMREGYEAVLDAIGEASQKVIGRTNPEVHMQRGYALWKVAELTEDTNERTKLYFESSVSFDKAAMFFGNSEEYEVLFDRSLRYAAHMLYMAGDFAAASKMLTEHYDVVRKPSFATWDCARYEACLGNVAAAIKLLDVYVRVEPLYAHLMFGEPDFADMKAELYKLDRKLRDERRASFDLSADLSQYFDEAARCGIDEVVGKFGTMEQHIEYRRRALCVRDAPTYFLMLQLENASDRVRNQIFSTSTTGFEFLRIHLLYGDSSFAILTGLDYLNRDKTVLTRFEQEEALFAPVLAELSQQIGRIVYSARCNARDNFDKTMSVVTNVTRFLEQRGHKVDLVPAFLELPDRARHIDEMNYTESESLGIDALRFRNGALYELIGYEFMGASLLGRIQSPFTSSCFSPVSAGERALAVLEAVLLWEKVNYIDCPDALVELGMVYSLALDYDRFRQKGKNVRLERVADGSVSTKWRFSVTSPHSSKAFAIEFTRPDVQEKGMFKKRIPFENGDAIPVSVFLRAYLPVAASMRVGDIVENALSVMK